MIWIYTPQPPRHLNAFFIPPKLKYVQESKEVWILEVLQMPSVWPWIPMHSFIWSSRMTGFSTHAWAEIRMTYIGGFVKAGSGVVLGWSFCNAKRQKLAKAAKAKLLWHIIHYQINHRDQYHEEIKSIPRTIFAFFRVRNWENCQIHAYCTTNHCSPLPVQIHKHERK